jgi:hypothetical protein
MTEGLVHSINTSNGGVPKLPQPECRITLDGVHGDWQAMVPGARLEVGEAALELASYAAPCENIAGSFRDGVSVRPK